VKTCVQCNGKLGLGVRFRNSWSGRWWVHLHFCSVHCEKIYEVTRSEAKAKHRWYNFLGSDRSADSYAGDAPANSSAHRARRS
jgi:hypothetical protein